ncbi:MAG: hypothetical protein SW833_07790 [Cyanobacteriota bacterium]|nr:hypothetical protein [Cyanobacteriota bacterium]
MHNSLPSSHFERKILPPISDRDRGRIRPSNPQITAQCFLENSRYGETSPTQTEELESEL